MSAVTVLLLLALSYFSYGRRIALLMSALLTRGGMLSLALLVHVSSALTFGRSKIKNY